MKVSAVLKNARVSAQKARLVADLIRGKSVEQASVQDVAAQAARTLTSASTTAGLAPG